MQEIMEYRVRSRVAPEELDQKIGKIVTDEDYNILLTGPTKVLLPNGEPLCIYLPGAIPREITDRHYPVLHPIQTPTDARGLASGSLPVQRKKQMKYRNVKSSILGAIEPMGGGRYPFCRTTAWTGRNTELFKTLYPLFSEIGSLFKKHVPHRYAAQMEKTLQTGDEWRIADTPFTTITVNNNYPTGVHTDKGDLQQGFSCLTSIRRGEYTGGKLVFPEYRIAADMQDGDLMLMDAHQWHGNTEIFKQSEDAERISLVLYYRTDMMFCGTMDEESEKGNYLRSRPFKKNDKTDEELEYEFTVKGSV